MFTVGLGTHTQNEVTHLKLGGPKQIFFARTDQQPGQVGDLFRDGDVDLRLQMLGLDFLLRSQLRK
jgi:hypothetical protein